MKEKIRENKTLISFLLVIFLFYLVFNIVSFKHYGLMGDDIEFQQMYEMGLVNCLKWRWETWSSRVVIEAILIQLLQLPSILWIIMNTFMYTLAYYSITKLADIKNHFILDLILTAVFVMMPLNLFASAGLYATTINYLWPLALGLYSLSCTNEMYHDECSIQKVILCVLLVVLAASQEQMAALLVGFSFLFNVVYMFKKHKMNWKLIVMFIVSGVMLLLELTCPGNALRTSITTNMYPEFENFSLIQKVLLGFLSTFSKGILNLNSSIYLFLLSIILLGFMNQKTIVKIVSLIPTFIVWGVKQLVEYVPDSGIGQVIQQYNEYVSEVKFDGSTMLYVLCIVVGIVCILYVLYHSLEKKEFLVVGVILLAALLDHIVVGFTASVFTSSVRPMIFLYYLVIVVGMKLVKNIVEKVTIS